MNRKTVVIAVSAVAALLVAGIAFAQHGPGFFGHQRDPEKMRKFTTFVVNDLLDDLKATDQQRAQIIAIKDQLLADIGPVMAEHAKVHEQMLQEFTAPQVDRARVNAIVDQRLDEFRVFAHRAADAAIQVHDLLSPEQRTKLVEEIQKRHPPMP